MDNITRTHQSPLPRRNRPKQVLPQIYKFSELLNQSEEVIKSNDAPALHIDDFDLLRENFTFFQQLVKSGKYKKIYSENYECLKYIDRTLEEPSNVVLSLIDDMENKDRSYINAREFTKTTLEIPITYLLWNPILEEQQAISLHSLKGTLQPMCTNNIESMSLEDLKRIKEITLKISNEYQGLSNLEKAILISNYIQKTVQYVAEKNISETSSGTYITDSNGLEVTTLMTSIPQTVLFDKFGKCCGIAHATTLLMCNPEMDVNVRSIYGSGHVWNIMEVDGQYYYIDNTWAITRNPDRYEESLKARSFTSEYILFGQSKADEIGHHVPETIHPEIEQEDFPRELIDETQKRLVKVASFSNYDPPVFSSRLIK